MAHWPLFVFHLHYDLWCDLCLDEIAELADVSPIAAIKF